MAVYTQFGRPVSIVGGGLTITDIVDLEVSFDPELHEHWGGSSRFPRASIGNDNTTITLKTTDVAALAWVKGLEVLTVVATFEGTTTAITAAGAATKGSGAIVVTISTCRVVDAFQIKNSADGKPGEINVKFRAAVTESTCAVPTITIDAVI